MEDELDQYLEVFVTGVERGEAPVSTRTSESDLNVPFPVLPGHLGQYTAAPRAAAPTTTVRQASAYTAAPRYASMMLPATPATKAAGGSSPLPSPVMSASLPSSPEAPPPPPPGEAPPPPRIITNAATLTPRMSAAGGAETMLCPPCPPCARASGAGGGSILAILAIAGAGWYLSRR